MAIVELFSDSHQSDVFYATYVFAGGMRVNKMLSSGLTSIGVEGDETVGTLTTFIKDRKISELRVKSDKHGVVFVDGKQLEEDVVWSDIPLHPEDHLNIIVVNYLSTPASEVQS